MHTWTAQFNPGAPSSLRSRLHRYMEAPPVPASHSLVCSHSKAAALQPPLQISEASVRPNFRGLDRGKMCWQLKATVVVDASTTRSSSRDPAFSPIGCGSNNLYRFAVCPRVCIAGISRDLPMSWAHLQHLAGPARETDAQANDQANARCMRLREPTEWRVVSQKEAKCSGAPASLAIPGGISACQSGCY